MRKIIKLQWEDQGELSSVVYKVTWAVEQSLNGIVHGTCGEKDISAPDPENFIPINELTEQNVLAWFPEEFWAPYEAYVQNLIDQELNPPANRGEGLPWNASV